MKANTMELVPASLSYTYYKYLYYDAKESVDEALQQRAYQQVMSDVQTGGSILTGTLDGVGMAVVLDSDRRWTRAATAMILEDDTATGGDVILQELDQTSTRALIRWCEGVVQLVDHTAESYAVERLSPVSVIGLIRWTDTEEASV